MGGLHFLLRFRAKGDHDSVARACRLAVERRAYENILFVAASGAVSDPAAVCEGALVTDRTQHRVVERAGFLAVERANGGVTDRHGGPPRLAGQSNRDLVGLQSDELVLPEAPTVLEIF